MGKTFVTNHSGGDSEFGRRKFATDPEIGVRHEHPNGSLDKGGDFGMVEGSIVTVEPLKIGFIDFGTQVSWIGLTAPQMRVLANHLNCTADELEGEAEPVAAELEAEAAAADKGKKPAKTKTPDDDGE